MANKSNSKKNNVFFTAEVFGMALALFSLLALLCLISGDSIFYDLGPTVQRFLLGVFGYLSFPVLLVTTFMGVKLLIGFRVENKTFKKACIYFALYLLFAGLIFQTAKTTVSGTYGDYITACYNGGLSLSSSTAGGVLLALINYPVVNYLSPVGGYVIYSFALAATTVVLLRKRIAIALSEREPRKTNQPSKKNNGDKADSAATDGDDFVNDDENDEQPEYAPPKKIIFGGGAFELKTDKEKKNTQNESGAGLKVLFDESDGLGVPSGRGSYSANPIEPERSYRESYDRDMQDKTDFVRRPYTARSTAPISNPMGSMSSTSASSYSTESGRDMDIDLSEPERDTYVINNGGYERRGIDSFRERSSEFTPSNYEGEGRADSAFDRSRSEDRFSAYSERPAYDRSDREGNSDSSFGRYGDFGERSGFSGSSRGVEEDRSSGYGEQSYARKPFTPFDGTQTRRSEESYTDGARTGSYSRMGERTPERMPERAPESTRSGYDEGAPSPSDRVRSFRPTESNERLGSYSTDGVSAEGYGERGDRRMDSGHRQTPFERARMAQQSRAEARAQEQQSPAQPEYTVPSSNEGYDEYDSGEVYGEQAIGSYFDASEPSKRKPRASISRDMSHKGETPNSTVVTSGSSLGTTKPAPLATGTSKSEANGSTSGTQLSIDSLPEKNRLENPIDNIPKSYKYVFPPIDLLNEYKPNANDERNNLEEQSQRKETILQVLSTVNIDAKIEDVKVGPAITRFELSIPPTISIKKVTEKQDDLTLWLKSKNKIRIVAPIAGTSRIGIEVSNSFAGTVGLRGLLEAREFKNASKSSLSFCLGRDIVGRPVLLDISKMPHLLVAGATGTGKSVFLNTLLISLMYKYTPEELRIILVDPKVVEFSLFRGMPNLMFDEVFTDNTKVCAMLEWAVELMEERYQLLNQALVKNIDEYNTFMAEKKGKKIPKLLIIIDEFADLMASSADRKLLENKIGRLAAKARAAGIHLIMATQRPSADIMEGSIKTNFTSRIAFKMASSTDAQVIMGEGGAEKLLGRGDVLYRTSNMPNAERAQGCFIDTPEIEKVCRFIKDNNKCYYDEFALEKINKISAGPEEEVASTSSDVVSTPARNDEECVKQAMRIAITAQSISTSGLQRKLGLGYPKAAKIVDILVERGYITVALENKTRKILMTKEQFEETFGEPL